MLYRYIYIGGLIIYVYIYKYIFQFAAYGQFLLLMVKLLKYDKMSVFFPKSCALLFCKYNFYALF